MDAIGPRCSAALVHPARDPLSLSHRDSHTCGIRLPGCTRRTLQSASARVKGVGGESRGQPRAAPSEAHSGRRERGQATAATESSLFTPTREPHSLAGGRGGWGQRARAAPADGAAKEQSAQEGSSQGGQLAAVREPLGVIIVDHGSRRQASNELLDAFVAVYKEATGRSLVEPAHMELAEPSLALAFARCVERGARTVVVSPYFLSPGRHWAKDIPELTAAAARQHPGVAFLVAAPIGVHSLVAHVVEERIQQCLSHVAGQADECDVCAGSGRCRLRNGTEPTLEEVPAGSASA